MKKPLLHLEHPEDMVLTGDLSVIDAIYSKQAHISQKIDGAPAVVWGIDPNNGEFFVGTKSVFNKKKIKRIYRPQDVFKYYNFATHRSLMYVLAACWENLPRWPGIYQGDFIGFGGNASYKPNTITYDFGRDIDAVVIIAPHTYYTGNDFPTMEAHPLTEHLVDPAGCVHFVQPVVDKVSWESDAPKIKTDDIKFLSDKEAYQAKTAINALIRSGQNVSFEDLVGILGDESLANLYAYVEELKYELMEEMIVTDAPRAFIGDRQIRDGEGYVMSVGDLSFKLVDRTNFSYVNFNNGRFQ